MPQITRDQAIVEIPIGELLTMLQSNGILVGWAVADLESIIYDSASQRLIVKRKPITR